MKKNCLLENRFEGKRACDRTNRAIALDSRVGLVKLVGMLLKRYLDKIVVKDDADTRFPALLFYPGQLNFCCHPLFAEVMKSSRFRHR